MPNIFSSYAKAYKTLHSNSTYYIVHFDNF